MQMLPNPFGTHIVNANAMQPAGQPAGQPASQPASRHKNLDFRGCPGPIAKPTQIDPLGALLGPGEQFPICVVLAAVLAFPQNPPKSTFWEDFRAMASKFQF